MKRVTWTHIAPSVSRYSPKLSPIKTSSTVIFIVLFLQTESCIFQRQLIYIRKQRKRFIRREKNRWFVLRKFDIWCCEILRRYMWSCECGIVAHILHTSIELNFVKFRATCTYAQKPLIIQILTQQWRHQTFKEVVTKLCLFWHISQYTEYVSPNLLILFLLFRWPRIVVRGKVILCFHNSVPLFTRVGVLIQQCTRSVRKVHHPRNRFESLW